jgi:creatinine amidohydrolase/Fe(II)-dependent formamide hydrolase-like protein
MRKPAAFAYLFAAVLMSMAGTHAAAAPSVLLDDLTWTEVRDGLRSGTTTIIIPVGGTEQNGPHMALGKHNVRAAFLSARIATRLGHALVAPVVTYVPEGRVSPPGGHMRFPGTISVPDEAFAAILACAARSLKQHGFLDIVLVGDSGNYQGQLKEVAARLNREWAGSKTRAHYVAAYYQAATDDFDRTLRERGFKDQQIGVHAGVFADPGGRLLTEAEWNASQERWLPSEADKAYVRSLMQQPVMDPKQMAGWLSAPKQGIKGRPIDFQYVRHGG